MNVFGAINVYEICRIIFIFLLIINYVGNIAMSDVIKHGGRSEKL